MLQLRSSRLWLWFGVFLVTLVLYGSLLPAGKCLAMGKAFGWIHQPAWMLADKLRHMAAYFVLMVWFAQVIKKTRHLRVFFSLLMLGIVIEQLQGWTGYRVCDLGDVLANTLGALIGLCAGRTLLGDFLRHCDPVFSKTLFSPR